ncbi:arginase family protein [Vibrio tritonius]|uniref:arginase family protein n=1 Tax=Vibrio tritonius TaxID=1435069 RepID=UPI000838FD3F|nr:arginase family protein [Vibrio tritonius]
MADSAQKKPLRLFFPQWQGGDNPPYHFGAQLLNWLAPDPTGPVEEVKVAEPTSKGLSNEQGIVGRKALLAQLVDARAKIDKHQPDSIIVIGGDCLVDLAPFAYLNERYDGELAILWVDAHPDIMGPEQFEHAHAHVLGNLLGQGDSEFTAHVKQTVKASNVCYVGVNNTTEWETHEMERLGLQNISPAELAEKGTQAVVDWFKSTGAKHLAVHLDLDVLDPTTFRGLLFSKPDAEPNEFDGIAQGQLTMQQVVNVLRDVAKVADVVGLGVAEHLPWDAIAMKNMLASLPLLGDN